MTQTLGFTYFTRHGLPTRPYGYEYVRTGIASTTEVNGQITDIRNTQ